MSATLNVWCEGALVGVLAENQGGIRFQYDKGWLANGFDLAPGSMAFDGVANPALRPVFAGLHGPFNDSLPDGWGLLLMDRVLKQNKGLDPRQITPLHRLAYMGHRGMGILEYRPELLPAHEEELIDLAMVAEQSEQFLHGDTSDVLEALRICGGSPGGARPKATVAFSEDMGTCMSSFGELPKNYAHWIVKFRNDASNSGGDPVDMGRLEMAYADMARAAGLCVPQTHLLELAVSQRKEAYFAVQRFDRVGSRKLHFLSLAGYAYANHREPCLDYSTGVLAATRKLTKSDQDVAMAYRLMLFNVLAHNKDDHAKNFAYLFDPEDKRWRLAPAYDLTFNHGMSNQHTTSINGAGNPTFKDLKKVALERNLRQWAEVLDQVRAAISKWPDFAKSYDLSTARTHEVAKALQAIDRACAPTTASNTGA